MSHILDRRLRTMLRQLRKISDDGFDLSILVELATSDQPAKSYRPGEREALRDIYAEEAGLKPKSEARLRGERAMRAFLRDKQRQGEQA